MAESRGRILVLVIPEQKYTKDLVDVSRSLAEKYSSICYVSLNRPCSDLTKMLAETSVDLNKFYFVDAITKTARIPEASNTCTYISSPGALTELSLAVSNFFDRNKADCLIFDSLSTLFVYESEMVITKFVHFLMAKLKVVGCDAYFTVLKGDENSALVKDISMFADQIVDITKWGI